MQTFLFLFMWVFLSLNLLFQETLTVKSEFLLCAISPLSVFWVKIIFLLESFPLTYDLCICCEVVRCFSFHICGLLLQSFKSKINILVCVGYTFTTIHTVIESINYIIAFLCTRKNWLGTYCLIFYLTLFCRIFHGFKQNKVDF